MSTPDIPKPPPPPPPPPTVDTAAQAVDKQNYLRQRRGAGATLFAGAGPTTAGGALLGH